MIVGGVLAILFVAGLAVTLAIKRRYSFITEFNGQLRKADYPSFTSHPETSRCYTFEAPAADVARAVKRELLADHCTGSSTATMRAF